MEAFSAVDGEEMGLIPEVGIGCGFAFGHFRVQIPLPVAQMNLSQIIPKVHSACLRKGILGCLPSAYTAAAVVRVVVNAFQALP